MQRIGKFGALRERILAYADGSRLVQFGEQTTQVFHPAENKTDHGIFAGAAFAPPPRPGIGPSGGAVRQPAAGRGELLQGLGQAKQFLLPHGMIIGRGQADCPGSLPAGCGFSHPALQRTLAGHVPRAGLELPHGHAEGIFQDGAEPGGQLRLGSPPELAQLLVGLQERLLDHVSSVQLSTQSRAQLPAGLSVQELRGSVPGLRLGILWVCAMRWSAKLRTDPWFELALLDSSVTRGYCLSQDMPVCSRVEFLFYHDQRRMRA